MPLLSPHRLLQNCKVISKCNFAIKFIVICHAGFPGGLAIKNPPANAGDASSIPGLGRSPGERNGNPVQYSCLGNPMDRGGWWATVHGVTESGMTYLLKQQ